MRRVSIRGLSAGAVLVVATACSASGSGRAVVQDRTRVDVLAIGDSLLYEAQVPLRAAMAGRLVVIRAVPGGALCDLARDVPGLLARFRPRTVVVESVANGLSPCIRGAGALGSPAFTRQYRRDLRTVVRAARAGGARVVVVDPPPVGALSASSNPALTRLTRLWHSDQRRTVGVTFTAGPRNAVSDGGRYVASLPCDRSETSRAECRDGRIAVRDDYFGLHFCPATYADASAVRRGCAVYSSGARRFGRAIARAVRGG